MRLSEKLGKQAQTQQLQTDPGLQVGSIRGVPLSYAQTITALYRGQTVTLLGSADIVGMSQCEKFVPHGSALNVPDWAPSEDFDVIAINGVPVGTAAGAFATEQTVSRRRQQQQQS